MNRSIRNRTYGGVGGRRVKPVSYVMQTEARAELETAPRVQPATNMSESANSRPRLNADRALPW